MTTRGEYDPAIPGIYKIAFARHQNARIGPTHRSPDAARACTAELERRINRREIRRLRSTRYVVGANKTAIVLIEAAAKPAPLESRDKATRAKLDAEQVREIRAMAADGQTYIAIAKHYPLTSAAIRLVALGLTYRWVK